MIFFMKLDLKNILLKTNKEYLNLSENEKYLESIKHMY